VATPVLVLPLALVLSLLSPLALLATELLFLPPLTALLPSLAPSLSPPLPVPSPSSLLKSFPCNFFLSY
jgi:hypothetical protein